MGWFGLAGASPRSRLADASLGFGLAGASLDSGLAGASLGFGLAGASPRSRLAGASLGFGLAGASPRFRLAGASLDSGLAGASPRSRLAGASPRFLGWWLLTGRGWENCVFPARFARQMKGKAAASSSKLDRHPFFLSLASALFVHYTPSYKKME